jgi:hypothetical protein
MAVWMLDSVRVGRSPRTSREDAETATAIAIQPGKVIDLTLALGYVFGDSKGSQYVNAPGSAQIAQRFQIRLILRHLTG